MPHFTTERGAWLAGDTPTTTEFSDIATKIAQAINGAKGGAWRIQNLMTIAGFGVTGTGPIVIFGQDGSLTLGTGGSILFNDGDWPMLDQWHTGTQVKRVVSPFVAYPIPWYAGRHRFPANTARADIRPESYPPVGIQANALAFLDLSLAAPNQLVAPIMRFPLDEDLFDGATLRTVTLWYRVPSPAPAAFAKVRVIRMDPDGSVTPLTSTAAGADADGFVQIPASAAKSAGSSTGRFGAALTLTIPIDVVTVLANSLPANVVDKATGEYYVDVVEQPDTSGSAPWQLTVLTPVKAASTGNLTLSAPQSVDGVALVANDRVLVKNQTDVTQNGVYVVQAAAWTRASDLASAAQFTAKIVVPVSPLGTVNGQPRSMWALFSTPPTTLWSPGSAAGTYDGVLFGGVDEFPYVGPRNSDTVPGLFPVGCLYTSVQLDMVISDLRPQ